MLNKNAQKIRDYILENEATFSSMDVSAWPGMLNTPVLTTETQRVQIASVMEEIAAQGEGMSIGAFLEGLTPDPVPTGYEVAVPSLRRYFSELLKGHQDSFNIVSDSAQSLFSTLVTLGVLQQTTMDAVVALSEIWKSPAQTLGFNSNISEAWCIAIKEDLSWA
jgi:hypothetical protein